MKEEEMKGDNFTESELRSALRQVSKENDESGGSMILWRDSENIRYLREMCRLESEKPVVSVARDIIAGFEVL
jgi:hypothetical protein